MRFRSFRNGDGEDDAMLRDVASYQCGSGSNPDVDADAMYGLRLLLVLSSSPRGFSPGTPVFLSPKILTLF